MSYIATETKKLKDEPRLNYSNKLVNKHQFGKTIALTFKKYFIAAIFPKGRAMIHPVSEIVQIIFELFQILSSGISLKITETRARVRAN